VGINLGRNVWQSPQPVAMAKALRAIVHDKVSVKQANEIYKATKASK
jgi:putative autoinducer-2 (AI-2) aldolase